MAAYSNTVGYIECQKNASQPNANVCQLYNNKVTKELILQFQRRSCSNVIFSTLPRCCINAASQNAYVSILQTRPKLKFIVIVLQAIPGQHRAIEYNNWIYLPGTPSLACRFGLLDSLYFTLKPLNPTLVQEPGPAVSLLWIQPCFCFYGLLKQIHRMVYFLQTTLHDSRLSFELRTII